MQQPSSRFYEFGPFRVDTAKRVLLREGEPVSLSPKAFDTLLMLVQHAGEVLEKDRLMDLLWPDSAVEEANLPLNVSALRKALGETPNERGYITTIPGRGYRFASAVQALGAEEPDLIIGRRQRATVLIHEHDPSGDAQSYSSERVLPAVASAANRWKRTVVSVALLGVLITVVVAIYRRSGTSTSNAQPLVKSLAVLPFKPLDQTNADEILALGMAESLITRLSSLGEVIVRPSTSVLRRSLEGRQGVEVGRELGVEAVLEGSIQRAGDKIRWTARLVRVADGSSLWAEQFDAKDTDMLALEDSIAGRVAAALVPRLTGEEKHRLAKRYTDNTEAHKFYVMGRFAWGKKTAEGIKKAIKLFEQAIDEDHNYALAYAGLADSYRLINDQPQREVLQKAKDNALEALRIDDSLVEAHVSLAMIKFQYDFDLPGADSEYKRAIELDPNYAYGHAQYAQYLSFCGRFDEAAAEIKRAKDLDPAERLTFRVEGLLSHFQGHFDHAIEIYKAVLELDPQYFHARRELGLAYEQKGMYEEALKELQLTLDQGGNFFRSANLADIAHVYAIWGKRSKAKKILDELKEQSKRTYVSPYEIAIIYAGLGEKDQTLDWLDKAYEDRSFWQPKLKVDPRLDLCRSDPRFIALLRKIGLQ